jgi:hypothetical protein
MNSTPEADDALSAARGIVNALAISSGIWLALVLALLAVL